MSVSSLMVAPDIARSTSCCHDSFVVVVTGATGCGCVTAGLG